MNRHTPQPNEIYRHFKGNCYLIVTIAEDSETGKQLVIYQALYGSNKIYARELSMFLSPVDREKYPETQQEFRFELLQNTVTTPVMAGAGVTGENVAVPEIDPRVLQFLDADTYEDRLQILNMMHDTITDEMINTMAVSIDVEIKEGPIDQRYGELKYCLLTRERFECNRLR